MVFGLFVSEALPFGVGLLFVIPMFFVSWHDGAEYGMNRHECNVALANIICYGRL